MIKTYAVTWALSQQPSLQGLCTVRDFAKPHSSKGPPEVIQAFLTQSLPELRLLRSVHAYVQIGRIVTHGALEAAKNPYKG